MSFILLILPVRPSVHQSARLVTPYLRPSVRPLFYIHISEKAYFQNGNFGKL